RSTCERETQTGTYCAFAGTSQSWPGKTGIPRSVARASERSTGHPARRTWWASLAGLRFYQRGFPYPAFVLLAARWTPEIHKDRGVSEGPSDAPCSKECTAGMESANALSDANGFYLCLGTSSRTKAARLGCVLKR